MTPSSLPAVLIATSLVACAPPAGGDDVAASSPNVAPAPDVIADTPPPAADLPLARPRHPPRTNVVEADSARARLLVPGAGLVAGETTTLALHLDLDEHWHVYWPGQNDSGYALEFEVTLPDGWSLGPTAWPAPERYASDGFVDHVYHDVATLLLPVSVPADAAPGPVRISAVASWLVCQAELCLPGEAELTLDVEVVAPGHRVMARDDDAALIAAARARLPRSLPDDVTLTRDGAELVLRAPGATRLVFLPHADGLALKEIEARNAAEGDSLRLGLEPRLPGGPRLQGVLTVQREDSDTPDHYHVDLLPPGA